ncbi:Tripeptidyl-peptidase sed3 [Hypsizygus marmoreus]|uniref:tripeptidyl-peptidase II n=1 Tax=Hypsizygus marmoreus TaxID=39966 RepID=A0A369JI53_HYPMA|nr:Tripeptidyl-peptidase sed3 [Hypsizygus marmoreus]
MRSFSFTGLLCLVSIAPFLRVLAAPPKACAPKVKESVIPPRGWTQHGIPSPDHTIVLRIALPQPDFNLLEKHLYEVSDPSHARYGDHLSKEEVERLVAPHQDSIDAVDEWLRSYNIDSNDVHRSAAKDWVTVKIPVSLAEKMLDTTYHVWEHSDGDQIVRTTSYSLPENLHAHIDLVQPTTMFGRFKGLKSTIVWPDEAEAPPQLKTLVGTVNTASGAIVDASCNTTITIKCLQQLYNAVGFTPKILKNSIGITGYLEQFANIQDLQSFYAEQRPDALNSSFKFISVKGGLNDQNLSLAGAEANLDVQFAFGLSFPIPGTFWSTAGRPPFKPDVGTPTNTNEPYTDWLDFVLSHPSPPLSISTSYGDDEQTVPKSFAIRACASFAQLGVRGVSLMFSSGDGGVGDNNPNPATQQCFTNDGRNATRFIPLFPASCPFVTSVGGTVGVPEVAVSRFFSGGGFSDYFERPWYQEKAVKKHLSTLPKGTYKGLYNPKGRGIPDVAAQGDRFRIFLSGVPRMIGGTSASSPTFAGIVALLNDVRLSKKLPPLGFLNPLLYSVDSSAFNDITVGHNSGCGTTGFNATRGWDPVTGLGTPNFGILAKLVVQKGH